MRLYEESVRSIKSSPVMHLLHTMRLDSRKHIEICQAAIEVLEGQQFIAPEKKELVEGLKRHVELEKEAIARANKILENPWIQESPGLRELVQLSDVAQSWGRYLVEPTIRQLALKTRSHVPLGCGPAQTRIVLLSLACDRLASAG